MLHIALFCSFLFASEISGRVSPKPLLLQKYKNNRSVKMLQEYIQIDTSCLDNVDVAVEFWKRQAIKLGLPYHVYKAGWLPVFVMTLSGSKPDLPSILLNTHSDVAPAEAELWTYPPFSAHINNNSDMYGCGTQNAKSMGIQYIEAIRKLIQRNVTLDRTVHFMVVPDEETGSYGGLKPFVETDQFESLNIGFALDEGMTSSDDVMYACYTDKRPWQMKFDIYGNGGHGSSLTKGTAIMQVQTLINKAMKYRNQQALLQQSRPPLECGASTSLNINIVKVDSWVAELSNKTTLEFIRRENVSAVTDISDSNPYWVVMQQTVKDLGLNMQPIVCPATTDLLLLRGLGIPAIGFSTRNNMIDRLDNIDEYIPIDNFLRGIDVYVELIKRLANLQEVDI